MWISSTERGKFCYVNGISCVLTGEVRITCERVVVPCSRSSTTDLHLGSIKLACGHWERLFSQLKVLTWVHNYPKAERVNLNDWYIICIGSQGCCLHSLQRTHCTGWTITESFLRIIKHKPAFIPHAGFELLLNNFFNSFSLGFCSTWRSCVFHLHSFQNHRVDPAALVQDTSSSKEELYLCWDDVGCLFIVTMTRYCLTYWFPVGLVAVEWKELSCWGKGKWLCRC